MKNFEIDTDNDIRMLHSGQVSAENPTFTSEQELRRIVVNWPLSRLVEVWNQLPCAGEPATPRPHLPPLSNSQYGLISTGS